jgi:hypothetical protein
LKQCRVSNQRYYAGYFNRHEPLSVYVSLTRTGIPRIIPARLRWKIARRDAEADKLVQLSLSWFGVSKLIKLALKISSAELKSIITPTEDIEELRSVLGEMKISFPKLQSISSTLGYPGFL